MPRSNFWYTGGLSPLQMIAVTNTLPPGNVLDTRRSRGDVDPAHACARRHPEPEFSPNIDRADRPMCRGAHGPRYWCAGVAGGRAVGLLRVVSSPTARSIERFSRTGSGHPRRPHPRDLRAAAPGRHAHGTSGGHPPRVSERDRRRVLVCGTFESPHARLCFCVLTVSPTAFPALSTP